MAYKQKGCTPITAKIQKTTKGGVTNPLLKAMGVPMKKNPSVAKQTSMGPVPLPKESNSVVQNMSYYSSDAGKAMSKSIRENREKAEKETRNKNVTPKQKEFAKKKHQGRYYKEPAKTNITKKVNTKGEGSGTVTVANNSKKSSSGKITGKIGSDLRKAQYDKKGWKYDDTIKGYDKSGNKIKASAARPKVKAVSSIEASKPKVEKTAEIKITPKVAKTKKEVRVENRTNRQTARKENRANRKATREENRANRRAARKGSPAKQTMQQQNRKKRREDNKKVL